MGLRGSLGKLAYRHFIRYEDIRPAPTAAELPTLSYTQLPLPRGYLAGCTTSNNGVDADHDIDISAGQARNTGDSANILITSSITKRIDATWASGTGNGGLNDTDQPVGNNTWYHIHALGKSTNDAYDVGFDTSASAANLLADTAVVAAGFTTYRRIGSVLTDGTANILAFVQTGNHFEWPDPIGDAFTTVTQNSELTHTLSGSPLGVSVIADIQFHITDTDAITAGYIYSTNVTGETPNVTNTAPYSMLRNGGTPSHDTRRFLMRVDTSAQINAYFACSSTINNVNYAVFGWFDDLGRHD